MIARMKSSELAPLSEEEALLARRSGMAIAGFASDEQNLMLTLTHIDGRRLEATVPTFALRLLGHVLEEMANGRPVTLIPQNAELTTHQAADLLGVSRPYLIKQLEAGKIPFRKVGTHRRIRYEDLAAHQERERALREKAMEELVHYSEEIGLYEMEDK